MDKRLEDIGDLLNDEINAINGFHRTGFGEKLRLEIFYLEYSRVLITHLALSSLNFRYTKYSCAREIL